MSAMEAEFFGDLHSRDVPVGGGKIEWELDKDLIYYSKVLDRLIVIPQGFRCDSYSVPALFAFITHGIDRRPAFLHDWICRGHVKGVNRKRADLAIKEACKVVGISWWRRRVIFRGTRIGDHLNIGGQGDEGASVVYPQHFADELRIDGDVGGADPGGG